MRAGTFNPLQMVNHTARLGDVLLQANLISEAQVTVTVHDQVQYSDMLFGEILALRGWLKQETADFFAEQWPKLSLETRRQRLGDYFKAAALLDQEQIDSVCREQWQTGYRFGAAAVLLGLIKQPTLDFFLTYLFPEERLAGPSMEKRLPEDQRLSQVAPQRPARSGCPVVDPRTTVIQAKETQIQPSPSDSDDINWIG